MDELTVEAGQVLNMRMPKHVTWTPREDITAHELALAIPVIFTMARGTMSYAEDFVAALPETARRHFTITDQYK